MKRLNLLRIWRRYQGQKLTVVLAICGLLVSALVGTGALLLAHPFASGPQGNVVLHGQTVPALAHAKPLRPTDGTTALSLEIALSPRDPATLDALIAAQSDKSSSYYHQYLTPDQFLQRFGPTQATINAVEAFLQQQGLSVGAVSSNHLLVSARGSVSTAEHAFGVQINDYSLGGRTVYAPANDPQMPAGLAASISGIVGLDNAVQLQSRVQRPQGKSPRIGPDTGPGGGYSPTDLRTAYDIAPLIATGSADGTGQNVAIFELAGFDSNDINTYLNYYSLATPAPVTKSVDGGASVGNGTIEVELDMEVVAAIAPGAKQYIYEAPGVYWYQVLDDYNKIVTDDLAKVVSTSWGSCEPNTPGSVISAQHNIFQQAVAQGQSVFAASGDAGAFDCDSSSVPDNRLEVDSPASDPNVIGVGGTTLNLNGDSTYNSESAWSCSSCTGTNRGPYGIGGGGGTSKVFGRPAYQSGPGIGGSPRYVPDVSADADPNTGYSIYCDSGDCIGTINGWGYVGGTSAAAPLWAGIAADLNEYLPTQGISNLKLGFFNPTLYAFYRSASPYAPFHDVTTGDNLYYSAGTGYDLATGIGSPDAWNMARDLTAPIITPVPGVIAVSTTTAGTSPAPQTLTIKNTGTGPLHWNETASVPSWLNLSASSGTIAAGTSANITLTITVPSSTSTQNFSTTLVIHDPNAANGDVQVPVTAVSANVSTTWYFAEGFESSNYAGFQTIITVANPNSSPAHLHFTYNLDQGALPVTHDVTVAPNSRYSENVNQVIQAARGTHYYGMATVLTSDLPVVAERPIYYYYPLGGGSGPRTRTGDDVVGATSLSSTFAFADLDTRTSDAHRTLLTFLNPTASTMCANLTFYPAAGGSPISDQYSIPANARGGIDLAAFDAHLSNGLFSGTVQLTGPDCTTPVGGLVERPMYATNPSTGYQEADDVIGVPAAGTNWYFAEGFNGTSGSRGQFHESLKLAYPAASGPTANLTVTIYKEGVSSPVVVTPTLAAGHTLELDINAQLPGWTAGNSIKVISDQPILAERVLTWNQGATDALGSPAPSQLLYFAEGYTGGGFQEIVTLQNPQTATAYVTVTFLPESGGAPKVVTFVVAPQSRFSFLVNTYAPSPGLSMIVEANVPILAERPMYWSSGGTDVIGYQP